MESVVDIDRVIETVRKLLAKAKDPAVTEAESQAFFEGANSILLKYNLAIADVDSKGIHSTGEKIRDSKIDFGKSPFAWKPQLVKVVAEHNFCRIYRQHKQRGKVVGMTLIGNPANIEITVMLLEWLFDQIKRYGTVGYREYNAKRNPLWDDHIDPLRWHVSFAQGATNRISERLSVIRAQQMAETAGVQALVVSVEHDIQEWLEEQEPWRKEERLRNEAWAAKMAQRKADREAWEAEHPEEAAAEKEAAAAKYAEMQEQWAKEAAKEERRQEAYYKKHGHYPGEGRRRRVYRDSDNLDYTAYNDGKSRADDINLTPHLKEGKQEPVSALA